MQKPRLPANRSDWATKGRPVIKKTALRPFTNGSNRTSLLLNVTALSKKITVDKKLPIIKAP